MDKKVVLTPKQKNLIKELDEITEIFNLNYNNIKQIDETYGKKSRTKIIEGIKESIIKSGIIESHLEIELCLNVIILLYFFSSYKKSIRLKARENFNLILDSLRFVDKLKLVSKITKMPNNLKKNIEKLNTLRNRIVHTSFSKDGKITYKNKNIFSLNGIKLFKEDRFKIGIFLVENITSIKISKLSLSELNSMINISNDALS